jgi:hypothetical protein
MRLGGVDDQAAGIWQSLRGLNWYYPVDRMHPLATSLAVHPRDQCADGQRQPLLAVRPFGRGQVVYVANDELWRLRRGAGEQYYRQFWSQLLTHLALEHPLGEAKRFRLAAEPAEAAPGEEVLLTLEAHDENFQPWRVDNSERPGLGLVVRSLTASESRSSDQQQLGQRAWRDVHHGRMEAVVAVQSPGVYRAEATDQAGQVVATVDWHVVDLSTEFHDPTRNTVLQARLAEMTDGRTYELSDIKNLSRDLRSQPVWEATPIERSLWQTPIWFMLVVGLLSLGWYLRFRWQLR